MHCALKLTSSATRIATFILYFGLLLVMVPLAARAEYPERPITLMVAYSPGGATDFQARIVTMLAEREEYLRQPVIIKNKPGAGGRVGWDWFAEKASKDGYQLAAYNVPHFLAQSILFDTKYDIRELEPIANWGADPAVLVVGAASPFKSVGDFIEYATANPGKVTVSGAGLYVGHHIALLQLERAAGIDLTYVPFKGGAPALNAVLGGQVMSGFNNLSDAYRNRTRLEILALADRQRSREFLPDVPTFLEEGVGVDNASINLRGIMAPKGVPSEIVDLLSARISHMFRDPEVAEKMKSGGSPMLVLERDAVLRIWQEREEQLKSLLPGLVGR